MSEHAAVSQLSPTRDVASASGTRSVAATVLRGAFLKLNPFKLVRNPALFITEIAAAIGTVLQVNAFWTARAARVFDLLMAAAIWLVLLSATGCEAFAEARERRRADRFRRSQCDSLARRVAGHRIEIVVPSKLRAGDVVIVETGELVPVDGEIIDGIATVDESPITGESAPVIRESGSDTSVATAGTRVLSGTIRVRAAKSSGETLVERMIACLEVSNDGRTPDEVRIHTVIWVASLLAALFDASLIFNSFFSGADVERSAPTLPDFAGMLICLMPISIAALARSCGVAGLGRLLENRVVVNARASVEFARHLTTVLLDKTGTVTVGNREAIEFLPVEGVSLEEIAEAAYLASVWDSTPEGTSTLALAQKLFSDLPRRFGDITARPVEFSEFTRMSGADLGTRALRKGAVESVSSFVKERGGKVISSMTEAAGQIARSGGTPLAVADGSRLLGLIYLRDVVKPGIAARMDVLRQMGIRSVLMTGDNPVTGSAIAHEAGMDDVLAQATPADKLTHIRREQERGEVIAMVGDGADDAPSLAQADIGLAMNCGSRAAKEAGSLVALADDPSDIVSVAAIGRQIWAARSAILAYSLFAGISNCLVLVPVLMRSSHHELARFAMVPDVNRAMLSAVLFQAVTVTALLPAALSGVLYWAVRMRTLLWRNAVLFAAAGLVIPPIGIWIIYQLLTALRMPLG